MEGENSNHKFSSLQLEGNSDRLDFYKLHYPNRKPVQSVSKASNKMRSKSVVSVLQSNQNQQQYSYNPKGSVRKQVANKQIKSHSMFVREKQRQLNYKENLSFNTILSCKTSHRNYNNVILPINNEKQMQEFSKKNINVRIALQKSRDEKIKMNKIIMSHKQNQQVKLEYLKSKRQEEINSIYCQFFKKQYEQLYGVEEGQDRFQSKLAELVSTLSHRIFN